MKKSGRSTIAGTEPPANVSEMPPTRTNGPSAHQSERDPMKHPNITTKGVLVKVPELLFNPGEVLMTPGILGLLDGEKLAFLEVISCLARHVSGDWGELDGHDRRRN